MGGTSLRELIARLIEDGKAWATAEIAVVKATALAWLTPAKIAIPLVVIAILLLQAALTVLIAALGLALVKWIGLAGGLAIGAFIALVVAGGLVLIAVNQFKGVGK